MRGIVCWGAITLLSASFATTALAQEGDDEAAYGSRAVQNRHYQGTHELTLWLGILPLDAFTKGVTLGGSYTAHFTDSWGWEVVNYQYSFQFDTDLEAALDPFELEPTPFEVLEHLVTTNIVFKPIYWKGALRDSLIVHGEIGLVLGGGVGWFTRSRRATIDYGVSFRFYLARWLSLRVDVRHNMFFADAIDNLDLEHELWTALGLGAQF
ncbi:MAG: outer membrane beta-barrel domain-containing protein [Myxococcota bacterium]